MTENTGKISLLRFGVFEMCLKTGELRKSGRLVHLAPQPFQLLALLISKPGELVTREEVLRELWADDTIVDFEKSLSFAVKKARAALGDNSHSPRYIETLPRRGYRFLAHVVKVSGSDGSPTIGTEITKAEDVAVRPYRQRG
jgi:cholera toxin transcriptional activator